MRYSRYSVGVILGLFVLCGTTQNLRAQDEDLSKKARRFVGENGVKYIQPAVSVFSANLNSGLYHTADVHDVFGFEIGLVGMLAPIPTEKKTFVAVAPDTIRQDNSVYIVGRDYDKYITTSTAVGSENGTKVYRKGAAPTDLSIYEFPGGADLKMAPLVSPQLTVGLPLGTEFILRFVPETKLSENVGKLKFIGVGFRHSISQWFPGPSPVATPASGSFPFNISVNFMYQKFTITDSAGGEFIKTKAYSAGVQASKKFAIFTLYGGLAYENAKTDITYTYRPKSESYPEARQHPLDVRLLDMDGDNNLRATLGLNLHLLILDVFADYSFASQPVAAVGIVLSFR